MSAEEDDPINPKHYRDNPEGIECKQVARYMTFNCGNVIKYLWRAGLKVMPGEDSKTARLRDLKKARWYLDDEIDLVEAEIRRE